MEFEIIEEKDAPINQSNLTEEGKKRLALIKSLKPGKVARVKVENLMEPRRAFKTALSRVAGKEKPKVELEMWGDETYVYIRLAKPKEPTPA